MELVLLWISILFAKKKLCYNVNLKIDIIKIFLYKITFLTTQRTLEMLEPITSASHQKRLTLAYVYEAVFKEGAEESNRAITDVVCTGQ